MPSLHRTQLERWTSLWHGLGAAGDPTPAHHRLAVAYSEPHRHYHNLQHLDECLREFDETRALARDPALVEITLWFHDAVYDPRSGTNEEDSAALADSILADASLPAPRIADVRTLILCTKTHQPGPHPDAALLIDIDLAILGQPASRFFEYERAIRAEYAWVPAVIYAEKRSEILARFLQRPALYATPRFRERYETTARANLTQALAALGNPVADFH